MVQRLLARDDRLWLSRSWTTRSRRPGEPEDAYVFVDRPTFLAHVADGGFLEHAEFLGNLYGTPLPESEPGHDVLLEIEVQGARQVRGTLPEAVQVFIVPPSVEALRARLDGRGTDDPDEVERRLQVAATELEARGEFAHVVVNDDVERAAAELEALVRRSLHSGA